MDEAPRQPDSPFDLTILYMEDARAWCEYLFDIFQPYEVYQNSEEITNFPTHETTLNNIRDSRVVIVIVSPVFLDHASELLEEYTHQVVALLCGVAEEDLKNIEDTVPSYKNWKIVEAQSGQRNITQVTLRLLDDVDSDEDDEVVDGSRRINLVEEEPEDTYLAMEGNIANRGQQQQSGKDDDIYLTMHGNVRSGEEPEDDYQTMDHMGGVPEDVYEPMTRGQSSVDTDDTYELMTGKGARMPPGVRIPTGVRMPPGVRVLPKTRGHQFGNKGHGYINDKADQQYSKNVVITPTRMRSGTSEPLFVIFNEIQVSTHVDDMYKAVFKWNSGSANVVSIVVNPYTLRINRLPENIPSGPVTVEILHNNQNIATLELKVGGPMDTMSDLLRTITNPFEFMCEALNISPADCNTLDNVLYQHCEKHVPSEGSGSFQNIFGTTQETQQDITRRTEVPTVLHFAAKYKLKMMCSNLLSYPGAYQAMQTKNCDGDTPSSLAEKSGDESLKIFLENYIEEAALEGNQHPDEMGRVKFGGNYVDMTSKEKMHMNAQYINRFHGSDGKRSDYDRPFHIAIPAAQTLTRDDTIRSLISGNDQDVYDYYETNSFGSFKRQKDDEDDDDDEDADEYEHLDDEPPTRLPPNPIPPPPISPTRESITEHEQIVGNVRITSVAELEQTPRSNPGAGIPKEQQALIDLQNKVKNNEMSMDDAVALFKDSHEPQFAPPVSKEKSRKGFWDRRKKGEPLISPKPGPPPSPKPGPSPISPKPGTTFSGRSSATLPAGIILMPGSSNDKNKGGTSPRQQRAVDRPQGNFPKDVGLNRPSSTASNISAGSRNSTLSTGSRDSSYGSAAEPDEPEGEIPGNPPVVPRRGAPERDRVSGSGRTNRQRFSGRFENDYYDKPLPPIPGVTSRPKQPIPAPSGGRPSLDDLPMRDPPPAPRDQGRRTSDPSAAPATPSKPKPQPRRRVIPPQ